MIQYKATIKLLYYYLIPDITTIGIQIISLNVHYQKIHHILSGTFGGKCGGGNGGKTCGTTSGKRTNGNNDMNWFGTA